ncbi:hypothetical protein KC614_04350 [candidate division WWE3 bacterium]|uniref:Uncharacterized protein n=1 Tax=candidate division WWE3 bacterium TaxID=2053526 RepID=A0A955RSA7_UNCKA|nr:hypothetical protein [candidate division WWE3 bacterium]
MLSVDFDLQNSIWFFDIDDTLIDTEGASLQGTKGVGALFAARFDDETGKMVEDAVNQTFGLMVAGYRVKHDDDWQKVPGGKPAFDKLIERVTGVQDQVLRDFGHIKKWSREVFAKLACDDLRLEVTPELIAEAGDAYWITLTRHTTVFESAIKLFAFLHEHKRPIYLITSSDARLQMKDNGQFYYDPSYSEALKRERIELLREMGLDYRLVSIGDPEDKPHIDFFEKGLKKASGDLGYEVDPSTCVIVGDSYGGDIQTPLEKMGFRLGIRFHKAVEETRMENERLISTGDFGEVVEMMAA